MDKSTEIISNLEQFEAMVANFGPIVASYYLSLTRNGIPPDLAYQLTIDWHKIFWSKQFNPKPKMKNNPWLPHLVTKYLKTLKPKRVFEWGSGVSTLFWIELGVRQLVSIEHDLEWYEKIKPDLLDWVDYHCIPFEEGEICNDKSDPRCYKSGSTQLGKVNFKNYASSIDDYGTFDLILIDGMARVSCLVHAFSHVGPGGCIVLDNTNDRPYYLERTLEMFGDYQTGWEVIKFMGYGPILDYKWETTIFINKRKMDYET